MFLRLNPQISSVELPLSEGSVIEIFLTNNKYIYTDKSLVDGNQYIFIFRQDFVGSRTVTLSPEFVLQDGEMFEVTIEPLSRTILKGIALEGKLY
jgi:hypothetical protein